MSENSEGLDFIMYVNSFDNFEIQGISETFL